MLDKYWRLGKTKNAFIPALHKRGSKGSVRNPKCKKIGRKPQIEMAGGKIITETDRVNFAAAIKLYYLHRNKLTLKSIYERLLCRFLLNYVRNQFRKKKLLSPSERPSLRQFRYWYAKQSKRNVTVKPRLI